jgi:processive 1,2-diacylglycerol beta-glucosyltransferase
MKILVLTLSFGSGHVQAAHAVARELTRQEPKAEVRVVDALAGCRLLFRAAYVWPYWAMIRYAPTLWARLFAARARRRSEQTAPAWAFRWGCPRVFKVISEFEPHTIIAVEVAACEMAVIAKMSGLTPARVINVITDHEAEPAWVKEEVNDYLVPDRTVAAQLHAWGAPADSIEISGIPINSSFHTGTNARETRLRYGFSDDAPLVLLMGGGIGPTSMDRVAARLCHTNTPMHIVALTGHDKRARRRLARLRATPPVTLKVLGWCDDVASLMQAATLLVTKPGGLTVTEAVACQLPVVMFDAIPGPERRNAERLVEAGAGVSTDGTEQTVAAVMSLLRDERARYAMSFNAREIKPLAAAARIARRALNTRDEKAMRATGRLA